MTRKGIEEKSKEYSSFYDALLKTNIVPQASEHGFSYKNPEDSIVPVADHKPLPVQIVKTFLSQTGTLGTKKLEINEFPVKKFEECEAKKRGLPKYTWSSVNFIPYNIKKKWDFLYSMQNKDNPNSKHVEALLENQTPNLALLHRGKLGSGVVALEDVKEGKPVVTYSGVLTPFTDEYLKSINHYVKVSPTECQLFKPVTIIDLGNSYRFNFSKMPHSLNKMLINGEKVGNYGSFISFAPRLDQLPLDFKQKDIATANVDMVANSVYNNYPVDYFIATQKISYGDLLVSSYGEDVESQKAFFEPKEIKPALFTKSGKFTLFYVDFQANSKTNSKTLHIKDWLQSKWQESKLSTQTRYGFFLPQELINLARASKFFGKEVNILREKLAEELYSSPNPYNAQ